MSKEIPKGKEIEGDMTVALDSRFLNSMVLKAAMDKSGKKKIPVVIDRVEHHESLKYENGQIDKNTYLLYFRVSDKPLKLCKTNIKRIVMAHGSLGKEWHGKTVNLVIEQTRRPDLGGKMGDCVRVENLTDMSL